MPVALDFYGGDQAADAADRQFMRDTDWMNKQKDAQFDRERKMYAWQQQMDNQQATNFLAPVYSYWQEAVKNGMSDYDFFDQMQTHIHNQPEYQAMNPLQRSIVDRNLNDTIMKLAQGYQNKANATPQDLAMAQQFAKRFGLQSALNNAPNMDTTETTLKRFNYTKNADGSYTSPTGSVISADQAPMAANAAVLNPNITLSQIEAFAQLRANDAAANAKLLAQQQGQNQLAVGWQAREHGYVPFGDVWVSSDGTQAFDQNGKVVPVPAGFKPTTGPNVAPTAGTPGATPSAATPGVATPGVTPAAPSGVTGVGTNQVLDYITKAQNQQNALDAYHKADTDYNATLAQLQNFAIPQPVDNSPSVMPGGGLIGGNPVGSVWVPRPGADPTVTQQLLKQLDAQRAARESALSAFTAANKAHDSALALRNSLKPEQLNAQINPQSMQALVNANQTRVSKYGSAFALNLLQKYRAAVAGHVSPDELKRIDIAIANTQGSH